LRRLTLGVVCGCVALVIATAAAVASPRLRDFLGFTTEPAPAYRIGETVDVPARLYEGASYTLVVFARASCGGCQLVKPVLADLVQQIGKTEHMRASFVMPSRSSADEVYYAQTIGLPASSVFPDVLGNFRVRVVPTALLVDDAGTIVAVSEGVGDSLRDLARVVASRVNGT